MSKTEKEKMLNGELYNPNDMELVKIRERANKITNSYNKAVVSDFEKRFNLLKDLLGYMDQNVYIEPPFRCDYGENIILKNNFYANFDCVMLDVNLIEIGENCFMGPGVHIYTVNHPLDPIERNSKKEYGEPVRIGDNVWLGGKSVINPGVTIGNNVVVASGSIVTRDFPDSVLIGGNPAQIIKRI